MAIGRRTAGKVGAHVDCDGEFAEVLFRHRRSASVVDIWLTIRLGHALDKDLMSTPRARAKQTEVSLVRD
eukprot:COSAG05_NODE_508_length_9135_cov_30.269780_5_plen_70_part_00